MVDKAEDIRTAVLLRRRKRAMARTVSYIDLETINREWELASIKSGVKVMLAIHTDGLAEGLRAVLEYVHLFTEEGMHQDNELQSRKPSSLRREWIVYLLAISSGTYYDRNVLRLEAHLVATRCN